MRAVVFGLIASVLALGSAQALDGTYTGKGGGPRDTSWNLRAKIAPATDGRFKVNVQSDNASCASEMDGVGTLANQTLRVTGDCDLSISVNGDNLQITEGPSCIMAHGAGCEFSGDVRKIE